MFKLRFNAESQNVTKRLYLNSKGLVIMGEKYPGDLESNGSDIIYGYQEPQISFGEANTLSPKFWQEFPVSYTASKVFITSDSVTAITLQYRIYTSSFDPLVWICLANGVFLMALIFSADIFSPVRMTYFLLEKFLQTFLSIIGSLLDQGWNEIPKEASRSSSFKNCNETSKPCLRECSSDPYDKIFYCDENKEIIRFNRNTSKTIGASQFQLFCPEDLEKIIENNLTLPQTALVIFSKEFEYYWDRLRIKMEGTNWKFAHNRNAGNDPLLRSPTSIYITKYFHEKYQYVVRRARIMLSSGLYSIWEKWDRIRFPECNSDFRSMKPHESDVRALSMERSLALALWAFLWGLVICLVVFLTEISVCYNYYY
ncbi:unnamed protein product [Allacma fusca]|uniref:Uncharacterized protein n=1 Tax=Allacma fusca TaxID=39272 RepID=A0A8J2KTC3_9HEXA|nr:unnamed protein product [Allacma fusca]